MGAYGGGGPTCPAAVYHLTGPRQRGGQIPLRSRPQGDASAVTVAVEGRAPAWEPHEPSPAIEPFRLAPLVTAMRWTTIVIALILLSTSEDATESDAVIGAALLAYALWRTIRPLEFSGGRRREAWPILLEGLLVVMAAVATDYWGSPYVFGLVPVIVAAGFAGGIPPALQVMAGSVAAIAVPLHLLEGQGGTRTTLQWAAWLGTVAMVAGYTRRLSLEAREESSRFAGRLRQLSEVNDLLLQLRSAAKTVPMSLDLVETLDSSVDRLQELLGPDAVMVALWEDARWSVVRSTGVHLVSQLAGRDLPEPLRRAADSTSPVLIVPLDDPGTPRIVEESRTGLYARLTARGELVGMVAVERRTDQAFTDHDVAVLTEFCQQMAIGIDNARWFSRIGTLAAEQERSRIARDLHDRVGQSLALIGFELDRAASRGAGAEVTGQLLELRENVRAVVTELRETLYDLRTDVSEERDLTVAMEDFLDRVGRRSGLAASFDHHVTRRLAVNAEREVWRIAQEAVYNAERHSGAGKVAIAWTCDEGGAELTVADDGVGIPASGDGRDGGYGLLGMQERANAIGGSLEISPTPGGGTTVRLRLSR
ncbi:MAG: sensor histidine kinase [Acidimicrobiales bacterium]